MAQRRPLILFGTGEIAELARFYFENDAQYKVVGFVDDDEVHTSDVKDGLPVFKRSDVARHFPPSAAAMHVALSYRKLNRNRQRAFEAMEAAGYDLVSYVCSKSVTWPDLKIGKNCFILENQTIQPTVVIGNNVMLWSGNHIGHGTEIGDHTYLASHVVISGHCKIGQRCFLGVNSTLRDFVSVGNDCFITMGAMVTRDLAAESIVLGSSGRVLGPGDRAGRRLRDQYFGSLE